MTFQHQNTCKAKKMHSRSQSRRAHLFFGARLIQQNSRFEFCFACYFFPVFYELACQNIQEKICRYIETLEQQTSSTLCSVLYLVHPKSGSIFQSCDRLKSDTSAAQKKKKKKKKNHVKKTHLGQVFQSVMSFETYLSFFFSLNTKQLLCNSTEII